MIIKGLCSQILKLRMYFKLNIPKRNRFYPGGTRQNGY